MNFTTAFKEHFWKGPYDCLIEYLEEYVKKQADHGASALPMGLHQVSMKQDPETHQRPQIQHMRTQTHRFG